MYAFGEFSLDLQLYRLRRGERIIPLEPKVFDVLCYLVERPHRVVTKQELLAALWPNEAVSDAVLPTNINALRRALGQERGHKLPIETVHGRGYRFAMPVQRASTPPPPASTAPASRDDASRASTEPLFGQRPLFDKLRAVLATALSGRGQICVLGGEAGIGKTRLAQRLAHSARGAGADVWIARSDDARDAAPLWMFRQLLRSVLQSEGGEQLSRWLDQPAADLPLLVPSDAGPGPFEISEDQAALRMFDAMLRILAPASRVRPRVLWLEDMHRADELSWQLLRMLAPHLEQLPVLVLSTVRSRDDLTAVMPVQRNLDLLQRLPHCQRFLVHGLELAQVHELARQLMGDVDVELARALHERSGGNPLFVRELVGGMQARGVRDPASLRDGPSVSPSELVRHVLRRRVLRLGPDAKRLLEASAVVGALWDASLVERVTGLAHDVCADAIDTALAHGVIAAVEGRVDAYRFAHDLLRDTLYGDLPTRERRRLHASVAAALEERVPCSGVEGVRAVARNLYQALPDADAPRTVSWLERAASLSEQQGSYREAAQLYRAALDAARLLPVADPAPTHALGASQARLAGLLRSAPAQS